MPDAPRGNAALLLQEPLGDQAVFSLKKLLLSGGTRALGGKVVTIFALLTTDALLARLLSPQTLGSEVELLAFVHTPEETVELRASNPLVRAALQEGSHL